MPSASPNSASAGGKIILLGEHAVVYGHQALAGAIGKVVQCRAEPGVAHSVLRIPAWGIEVRDDEDGVPSQALRALLQATNAGPTRLDVETDLPPAAGLGSSAALCLAIARCLAPDASDADHRAMAAAGESQFHHNPSGIDVALSQYGGIASYDLKGGLRPLKVPALSLVVALSGVPRSTATQVANVAERRQSDGGQTQDALDRIGELSQQGIAALLAGEMPTLGTCMTRCHRSLGDIGVSIEPLDAMVKIALDAGALGAKLTGAGGGGAMIALAPGNESQILAALQAHHYQAFTTTLGAKP